MSELRYFEEKDEHRRVLDRETRERLELERKDEILAFPQWTLMRIGWRVPSGQVQGGVFYRIANGLGPTTRDLHPEDILRREIQGSHPPYDHQEWGIEILAIPSGYKLSELLTKALCLNMGPRIGSDGAPRCKLIKGHRGTLHRPAIEDGWGNISW